MLSNLRLLKHQKPMLRTIGKIILRSFKKTSYQLPLIKKISHEFTLMPALDVINQYHKWLNCTAKYQSTIAPHLYPQWAIPELFKLGDQFGLPFHKILNQGCSLKINAPLPREVNLMGRVQIIDIKNYDNKIRMHQKIYTGPKENPIAVEADIFAVILKNNKKSFHSKKDHPTLDLHEYQELSKLYISKKDAKIYGLISGDVNPIHMSEQMAKMFGLKSSLMHGFGLYALLFEELERHGYIVHELDLKFLNPVYLNNLILIYFSCVSGKKYSIRIVSEDKKIIHLVGNLTTF